MVAPTLLQGSALSALGLALASIMLAMVATVE